MTKIGRAGLILMLTTAGRASDDAKTVALKSIRQPSTVEMERVRRVSESCGWNVVRSAAADKNNLVIFETAGEPDDRVERCLKKITSAFGGFRRMLVVETRNSIRIPTGEFLVFFDRGIPAAEAREVLRKANYSILSESQHENDVQFRVRPPDRQADPVGQLRKLPGVEAAEENFVYVRK